MRDGRGAWGGAEVFKAGGLAATGECVPTGRWWSELGKAPTALSHVWAAVTAAMFGGGNALIGAPRGLDDPPSVRSQCHSGQNRRPSPMPLFGSVPPWRR